jgi:anti-sigma factor RsiW
VSSCDRFHELLGSHFDGELDETAARELDEHVAGCRECAELKETMDMISETIAPVAGMEPPAHLQDDIASSPCRRWLGLLFSAVDREISEYNLDRLLPHLESCESCRRAWNDLTLIHQAGDAMEPPLGLLERCIAVRWKPMLRPVLGRRTVTAAAYVLAVLTTLTIGNPVSIARSPVVQRVAETVSSEVNVVAEEGRGELRVMAYRIWQWGSRQVAAARELLQPEQTTTDSASEQGDRT